MINKNQAMVNFLLTCPTIKNNPIFFNFANIEDNASQIVIKADSIDLNKPFIDGSVLKRFTFSLVIYKSVSYNALVKMEGYPDENLQDLQEVQKVLDWIDEQDTNSNYPDFGTDCEIDGMESLTNNPDLNGVDTSLNPPMAKYSIGVRLIYLDKSKVIWNKKEDI